MAKLTEQDAISTIEDEDLLYIVEDPSGSPASKKMTLTQLQDHFETTTLKEQDSDPSDPDEGESVIWQSDGASANSGDDGDIMIKITAGGVTKTGTLIDFSGL